MDTQIKLANPRHFYIGGEWVAPSTSATFKVLNCSTEEVMATVAEAQAADVDRAVTAARHAFDEGPWPRMTHAERATYLRRIAEEFTCRNDEFARVWSIESGIVYKVAQPRIGLFLSGAFKQYADMAATFPFLEPRRSATGHQGYIVREPVGTVAAIVPWNGPAGG